MRGSIIRFYTLDELHNPVPVASEVDFTRWLAEDPDRHQVGHADLGGGVIVSTVFVGFTTTPFDERPTLFETVVTGVGDTEPALRWGSHAEAVAGHHSVVSAVRRFLGAADPGPVRAGEGWCVADNCPAVVCNGPHRRVRTSLGEEQVRFDQEPIGEPLDERS